MKLWMQVNLNHSGKAKFAKLLAHHLKPYGIDTVFGRDGIKKKMDVVMGFSKFTGHAPGAKHILRLNGVNIINCKESRWRNGKIRQSILMANQVIWQSAFAQRFGRELLCKPSCPEFVIHNGSLCTPLKGLNQPGQSVLVVGKWMKNPHLIHKRWKELIHVIESYHRKDVRFNLCGVCEFSPPKQPNVLVQHVDEPKKMFTMMKDSTVMLNISCYDACPNAVVEALVSGLPVICNTGDGTEELVGKSGTVIDTGRPKPKLINKFRFKRFDVAEWHAALDHWIDNPKRVRRNDLHITTIAKEYAKVIKA